MKQSELISFARRARKGANIQGGNVHGGHVDGGKVQGGNVAQP